METFARVCDKFRLKLQKIPSTDLTRVSFRGFLRGQEYMRLFSAGTGDRLTTGFDRNRLPTASQVLNDNCLQHRRHKKLG